jgi:hypothetical protein
VEQLKTADVIFEGILMSLAKARVDRDVKQRRIVVHGPPGMVIAAADPRYLITVEVRKVSKGSEAEWCGTRTLAVHSLAQAFPDGEVDPGTTCQFHLWESRANPGTYVTLIAKR